MSKINLVITLNRSGYLLPKRLTKIHVSVASQRDIIVDNVIGMGKETIIPIHDANYVNSTDTLHHNVRKGTILIHDVNYVNNFDTLHHSVRNLTGKLQVLGGHQARPSGKTLLGARKRSLSPVRHSCNNVLYSNYNETSEFSDDDFSKGSQKPKFLYMSVNVGSSSVAALIDTGSSINVISKQYYDSLPESCKSVVSDVTDKIVLANNQTIKVSGISRVKINTPNHKHWILVHI